MLEPPAYVVQAGVIAAPIVYTWRPNKDVEIIEKNASKNIEQVVQELSLRASLCLGIAVGEWLRWRLQGLSTYTQVDYYVEALWARTVDPLYLRIESLDLPNDTGDPTTGPLFGLENVLYSVLMTSTLDHPDRGKSVAQV